MEKITQIGPKMKEKLSFPVIDGLTAEETAMYIDLVKVIAKYVPNSDPEDTRPEDRKKMKMAEKVLGILVETVRTEHKPRGPYYASLKWMQNNPGIKAMLERNPRLLPLMDWIDRETLRPSSDEAKRIYSLLGSDTEQRPLSLFIGNSDFYDSAAKAAGLSVIMVRKYVKELVRVGALSDLGRVPGVNGNVRIYSDGYCISYAGGYKKVRQLKNSKETAAAFVEIKPHAGK